jgi:Pyruvate/2-oxoacid:ferredoxin oxidoreductase gamma subunit
LSTKNNIPPASVLQGKAKPVQTDDLIAMIKQKAKNVYQVDGTSIAQKLGNLLVVNTVLLGAVSALPEIP